MHYDENADMAANYTIINWHRSAEDGSVVFEDVGYYSMHIKRGAKLFIDKTKILWNGYSSEVSVSLEDVHNNVCLFPLLFGLFSFFLK